MGEKHEFRQWFKGSFENSSFKLEYMICSAQKPVAEQKCWEAMDRSALPCLQPILDRMGFVHSRPLSAI